MNISIRRFGSQDREMVGVYQHGATDTPVRGRYLLCRPLGQEAVRTAATYRVLGDRLSRQGCESLRFDYHGTGDSPGEEQDQSLTDWVGDTVTAHEQLLGQPAAPVTWFGMGLGASLALRAALRTRFPPSQLVLWEPVLDGPAYVQALFEGHKTELVRMFRQPWPRLVAEGRVTEPALPGDILGFQIGRRLADELQSWHSLSVAAVLRRGVRVICTVRDEQRTHLSRLEGHALLRLQAPEQQIDWMSSQAMGTAIVPPDLLRTLLTSTN